MMEVIFTIDVDLIFKIAVFYLLIGFIALLIVLRMGLNDPYSRDEIEESLGAVVLIVLLLWPYNLIRWIFSWNAWLTPINRLFRHK